MVWTGKKRVVPQQFTMETFIPHFDFKGGNGFWGMRIPRRTIGDHGLMSMSVRVHQPRCSS